MTDFDQTEKEQLTREVQREGLAKSVLNNPEFKRVFISYSAELFESLKRTKWDDKEKREEIYRQLKSLDTMEAKFLEALQTGKMARHQLTKLQRAANAVKNVVGL